MTVIPDSSRQTPSTLFAVHGELLATANLPGLLTTPDLIVDLPGEFWVEVRDGSDVMLISSRNGLQQCFYYFDGEKLHFGPNVLSVQRSAGLPWKWSWRALACISYFGHLLGADTLHADIKRLGAGEILTCKNGRLSSRISPSASAVKLANPADSAVDALVAFTQQHGSDEAVVPLSAGFDSRLILAAFLHAGLRPHAWVMGDPQSTDVRIAGEIASEFKLELIRSNLPEADYFLERTRIVELTSGTKTVDNWHSYVGLKNANLEPGCKLFPGTNGELARTFFFDRGLLFYAAEIASRWSVPKFWDEKLKRFAQLPPEGVAAPLDNYFKQGRQEIREWLMDHYGRGKSLGEVIEQFYLRERVRSFISNGITLYSQFATVRMPLLSADWIAAVRQMPRPMKMGNAWHRYAISRLCPQLLHFGTDNTGAPMSTRPVSYWFGRPSHGPSTPYAPNIVGARRYADQLRAALPFIADVIDPESARRFIDSGAATPRGLAYVGTIAFWMELVRSSA